MNPVPRPAADAARGRRERVSVLASWRWWVALWAVSVPLWFVIGADMAALAAVLAAVAVHELGHWSVAAVLGVRGRMAVSPALGVTVFRPGDLTGGAGVLILAAGPAANLASAVMVATSPAGWLPGRTAFVVMSVVIGVFNLLPVPMLDGGRILLLLTEGDAPARNMARCMVHTGSAVFAIVAAARSWSTDRVTAVWLVLLGAVSVWVHSEEWGELVGRHGVMHVRRWMLLAVGPAAAAAVVATTVAARSM